MLIILAVLISREDNLASLFKMPSLKRVKSPNKAEEITSTTGHHIELRHVSKKFPGVQALDNISFSLNRGEVVALVGENGAGKSTLVKCISGVYRPEAGEILLDGKPVHFSAPGDAKGIGVIHQHFSLSPDLTVAENLFVGREPRGWFGLLNRRYMMREAQKIIKDLALDIAVDARLGNLSVGQQQMVEIARAVLSKSWFMIMDEPTSALSNRERDQLYQLIENLRHRGTAILYISHKMEEIFKLCSRAVILRDGCYVATCDLHNTRQEQIVSMMVGRDVGDIFPHITARMGEKAIELEAASDGRLLKSASLHVSCGEVVALAGLMGSGRSEILRLIAGFEPIKSGHLRVFGQNMAGGSLVAANQAGIVYIPEDRHFEGFVGTMSIRDNLALVWMRKHARWGILSMRTLNQFANKMITALNIRPPDGRKWAQELSGGNQQKVVIGKWLATDPKIILLDEPTRGVDVGAKSELHHLIASLKREGAAILMVSSELPEVLGVADRIIVMRDGYQVGELARGASEEDVMALAFAEPQQNRKSAA